MVVLGPGEGGRGEEKWADLRYRVQVKRTVLSDGLGIFVHQLISSLSRL